MYEATVHRLDLALQTDEAEAITPRKCRSVAALGGHTCTADGFSEKLVASNGNALTARANSEGGRRTRPYDQGERSFYGLVLAYGGPLVLALVAAALCGPSLDSVKRWRRNAPKLRFGTSTEAIVHNLLIASALLQKYGLDDGVLFTLDEDGTSAKKSFFLSTSNFAGDASLIATERGASCARTERQVRRGSR